MRILVVADIHANWTALQAVLKIEQTYDACLCVGDLVDYGVQPQPCINWARENCDAVVRGNHDHAVAQQVAPRRGGGFRLLAAATRPVHDSLDAESITWLARLPVTQFVELGGFSFHMVHATPRDPMDEYLTDEAEWRTRLESIDADFVLVGHTHIPMHVQAGNKQLVNPGSVGQPRDGIAKASYAVIEDGKVDLRRTQYAIEDELNLVREAGVTGEALKISETIIRRGFLVKPS
ncbi:MAG: metallophosphoesterase [Planctomycetaceae bacterium]